MVEIDCHIAVEFPIQGEHQNSKGSIVPVFLFLQEYLPVVVIKCFHFTCIMCFVICVICLSESIWSSSTAFFDYGSGFEIQQRNHIIAVHRMDKEGLQKVQIVR